MKQTVFVSNSQGTMALTDIFSATVPLIVYIHCAHIMTLFVFYTIIFISLTHLFSLNSHAYVTNI